MHLAQGIRKCLHEYGIHSSTIQPEFCLDPDHDHTAQVSVPSFLLLLLYLPSQSFDRFNLTNPLNRHLNMVALTSQTEMAKVLMPLVQAVQALALSSRRGILVKPVVPVGKIRVCLRATTIAEGRTSDAMILLHLLPRLPQRTGTAMSTPIDTQCTLNHFRFVVSLFQRRQFNFFSLELCSTEI